MRTTPIILDRLDASLMQHGVRLKRSQLLETAAMAFGYHSSNEFTAAARAGDLNMPQPDVVGRVTVADTDLVALRDHSGAIYAIEEGFLEQVVDQERRETFGPSPYGGLVDLTDVTAHPATAWDREAARPWPLEEGAKRHVARNGEGETIAETNDLEEARGACRTEEDRTDLDAYVVDRTDRTISRARCCWRPEPLPAIDACADVAAELFMARLERDEAVASHDTTLRISVPDWRAWEKDLKKASRKGQEPISDELLHQFRHAVADVHCKSSSSEKSEVVYRQARYVEKHLGGLIARLDRAEEALRDAGLAPKEIARKTKDDAAETLAAIEAVTSRRKDKSMPGLYEVDATRDGDKCREIFMVRDGEDPEDVGRRIAAKEFRIDLEDHRYPEAGSPDEEVDDDGNVIPDYSNFDSECDTFCVEAVDYPEAAAIISDALVELSTGGDFRYGIPHDHPARIKLIAARQMIVPKPTATDPAA